MLGSSGPLTTSSCSSGLGLVLPAALDAVAAASVVLLMVGAVVVRLHYGARTAIAFDLTLLALAAFVAWVAASVRSRSADASGRHR
jgi:hypothetical protein